MTRGRIGIFCLYTRYVLSESFDDTFIDRRTKLWFAAHPKLKLIIALTQFDRENYSESAYEQAKEKINDCMDLKKLKAIIPTAIDCNNLSGENIFENSKKMPWYTGLPLIRAVQDQWFDIANMQNNDHLVPKNLVFSIDREFPRPLSNAGKIWRVYVENGTIGIGSTVQLTSVLLKTHESERIGEFMPSVSAVVKEFRYDVCIDDDESDDPIAYRGSAITVNLKDCYAGRNRINKRQIYTTRQTVGLSKNENFSLINQICLRFENPEDILVLPEGTLDSDNPKQEVVLLVSGRGVPATITNVTDNYSKLFLKLLSDNQITVPEDEKLRSLDIFNRVIVRFQDGVDRDLRPDGSIWESPRYAYLPARIILDIDDL